MDEAERKMSFLFAVRTRGVTDKRVLTAMEAVDRGRFIRGTFAGRAYEDTPLPIACGQTISQPSVVGLMTQALDVQARHKVLEIGTGSGYQAAVLSPEAGAAIALRHPVVAPEEWLEDTRLVLVADARAGIGDLDDHLRVAASVAAGEPEHDLAALGELDRVADEHRNHAADAPGIAPALGHQRR